MKRPHPTISFRVANFTCEKNDRFSTWIPKPN